MTRIVSSASQMSLGLFLMGAGHHIAAWRLPDAPHGAATSFRHFRQIAQIAEAAKFDMIFFADSASIREFGHSAIGGDERAVRLEPLTLLSALSAATDRIGLVGTASTTYNEPFNLARRFASLDLLSNGRAGWNLVTTSNAEDGPNYSLAEHPHHAERYARAEEFEAVVRGLWHSWQGDDAFPIDKAGGRLFNPDRLHPLKHRGAHFDVRGPLGVPPSAQGHPVIVQAGASDAGREIAARSAEVIFAAHQNFDDAFAFYQDVKTRMARYGRAPDSLRILPGISPFIGRTRDQARAAFDELQALVTHEVGLKMLQPFTGGLDLRDYDPDGPLPDLPPTANAIGRQKLLVDLARRENLTIRQLYLHIAGARGHWQLVGTASDIADELEHYFRNGAADGFNVMPPALPRSLGPITEFLLPELRRRGLFRDEYTGATLRDHLGLPRPDLPAFPQSAA
ncbi:LLM class flavin-dependent oxidoreductase [Paracoccus laeviglucosivorans]|uniref:FMN-dependent oxidoreductase, nitrilotriacetate monooxygenase family n=1 Tax=Paracoccus laeviglucosivorans TaxID=1197861 RepID=A0A521EUJ9_9RHOB|nr:LLM class flavin-dependent oxidoreductase [Paracoccus laeviglucosivorans]SMO86800.1 FMN-dependent oxidoreductase, nitrilotriacetate monooxygenase family [Paracoccus laeviglucosivorans]